MSDANLAERSVLPPPPRHLDQVCNRFEMAWKKGQAEEEAVSPLLSASR